MLVANCPDQLTVAQVSRKSTSELDALFEVAFLAVCSAVYPGVDLEVLDGKRVGDRSYVTMYDLMKAHNMFVA